ncbi:Ribokinase [Fusarium oxysporum f. sp. albedinis]|nr:Ribokinase [Fusarium oxysporum f. sp. albedinis]
MDPSFLHPQTHRDFHQGVLYRDLDFIMMSIGNNNVAWRHVFLLQDVDFQIIRFSFTMAVGLGGSWNQPPAGPSWSNLHESRG